VRKIALNAWKQLHGKEMRKPAGVPLCKEVVKREVKERGMRESYVGESVCEGRNLVDRNSKKESPTRLK
jgi:hypothetical protein